MTIIWGDVLANISGKIHAYRVFDVGPDINLDKVADNLANHSITQRVKLSRPTRSIHIANAPLAMSMGTVQLKSLIFNVNVKIWAFGAISVIFEHEMIEKSWNDYIELGTFLEQDPTVTELAADKVRQVLTVLDPNRKPEIEIFEDYLVYSFKSLPKCEDDASKVLEVYDVPKLLLTENTNELSDQVKKMICEQIIQYNKNDLAAVTWNSALIVDPSVASDVADILEFALCQVLEMRYYDYVLERKLSSLYNDLESKKWGIWKNHAEALSEEAAKHYLEISETVENVENSLKVIGDFYLAQIFRVASLRFRFQDWRESVDQKLKNLAEISALINANVNARRSHLLELVIIILIAIELVPFALSFL
jgi:hypothetical protein